MNQQIDENIFEEELLSSIIYTDERDDDDVFTDATDVATPFTSYQPDQEDLRDQEDEDQSDDVNLVDEVDGPMESIFEERPCSTSHSSGSSNSSQITVVERGSTFPIDRPTHPVSIPRPLHQQSQEATVAFAVAPSRMYGSSSRRLSLTSSGSFVGLVAPEPGNSAPTYGTRMQNSLFIRHAVREAQYLPGKYQESNLIQIFVGGF